VSAVKEFISTQASNMANEAGLSLLDHVQSLREQVQSLGEQVQSLHDGMEAKREQDHLKFNYYEKLAKGTANTLRSTVLDAWSKSLTAQTRREARNALAHGEAVLLDYHVINHATNKGTKGKWKRAFQKHYTVDIQLCQDRFDSTFTHDSTVELLNQRANITTMEKWDDTKYKGKKLKDMQRSRDKITELCDTWITRWKQDGTITPSEALLEKIRGLDSKITFLDTT
jgi:hypothetical protein